jgi:hypothetical protein
MNKTLLIVGAALFVGYLFGNSGEKNNVRSSYAPVYVPSYSTSSDRTDELREKMEDARNDLENALSNARDLEDRATMRWLQTGNFNDMMRMNDAEDAARSIQSAIDNLND